MTSETSRSFWVCFHRLPLAVRMAASKQYKLFQVDPFHRSLHFKEIAPGLWSARINKGYRALAYREGDLLNWFWIGTHAEYDRLVK